MAAGAGMQLGSLAQAKGLAVAVLSSLVTLSTLLGIASLPFALGVLPH
jgi:hypothetical protein